MGRGGGKKTPKINVGEIILHSNVTVFNLLPELITVRINFILIREHHNLCFDKLQRLFISYNACYFSFKVQRGLYKDLVRLLQTNEYLEKDMLKRKVCMLQN